MKKKITLDEFTKKAGGQQGAAAIIGVDYSTYNRWVTGVSKPRGLAARALAERGVTIR